MSINNIEAPTQMTTDQDLVLIAGYQAYDEKERKDRFKVNHTRYEVLDSIADTETGLDALTIMNLSNEEITIAYVGTNIDQMQDIVTDIQLLSDLEVPQLVAAQAYFAEMNDTYGVTSITGNSLGGALVGAVAVKHPDVRAVTLNPALLPEGMMDSNQTYDNVTNYFSSYDALTNTLTELELDTRIPGKHYEIFNGTPIGLDKIGSNHTGYLRNAEGTQYYTIREEGEPGAGVIHIGADEHIVTSLWTGLPLYGGRSVQIKINPESLLVLASGLETTVTDRLDRSQSYLSHAVEIVEDVGIQLTERMTRLQATFEELVEGGANHSFFTGITSLGTKAKNDTDYLFGLLDEAELESTFLSDLLASTPAILLDHLVPRNIGVFQLYRELFGGLSSFRSGIDDLTSAFETIMYETIPEMLQDALRRRKDAVVGRLDTHYKMVLDNSHRLHDQLDILGEQVTKTAEGFEMRDTQIASSIQHKTGGLRELPKIPVLDPFHFKNSDDMKDRMALKDEQLDYAFTLLFERVSFLISPILSLLSFTALQIELGIKAIMGIVNGARIAFFKLTMPGTIISLFTDYDDKVRNYVSDTLAPLEEFEATIKGIRDGIDRLNDNFPDLLASFRPYIENAIFTNHSYADVYAYNSATISILKEMQLVFDDIVHQLNESEANSIQELVMNATKMKGNMGILQEQVERVTFF